MTTRQKWIVLFGILMTLFISLVLAIVLTKAKEQMIPPKAKQIVRKVDSKLVTYNDIVSNITSSGRVLSQHSIELIAEVQGKVQEGNVSLKKGTSFKKGQLIAKIYDKDAVYVMKSRKSSFMNSLANILPDMKIDYPDSYDTWVVFFKTIDINKDLPALPLSSSDQERIFLASRGILSDFYSIKSDEEKLKKYYIWAPYNGAIKDVMLEAGSVANPGSRIASIIKTSELEIEVPVSIENAKWIKTGQKAILSSESGQEIGIGWVSRESGFVDPNNQSINIYVSVTKGEKQLYAGQYLKVSFPGMTISDAMEIPRNATFNGNEVFIVIDGYLVKTEINILKINEKTLVFNGLDEGTELVVQPLANAHANTAVQSEHTKLHIQKADSMMTDKPTK